jgi:tetratricopeptide (TPR) repeat protein
MSSSPSSPTPPSTDPGASRSLSPKELEQIIEICEWFEAAWDLPGGEPPRIEPEVAASPEPLRARLLRELLALEIELRQRRGERPTPEEYRARFPDQEAAIVAAFDTIRQVMEGLPGTTGPRAEHAEPAAGTIVRYFGDYELLRELGRGGMGVVFEARQVSLNRKVAVKMILSGQYASPAEVVRFRAEAEAAAQLEHSGIVAIHEIGTHQGQHYFAMAYVEGSSLAARLREGPLPPREAADLLARVADAVEHAHHQGVIHRDLKPANVLLDVQGRPRVTDFGLARRVSSDGEKGLTITGQPIGTPSFMAPEQAAGVRSIGPAADVYALGATLYAALSGRPPFLAPSTAETLQLVREQEPVGLRTLNQSIPRDLETISLKCLRKEPSARYATAAELATDLRRWLAGEPIRARPISRLERVWRWCRRKPALAASWLGLALAIAGLTWFLTAKLRAEAENQRRQQEINRLEAVLQRIVSPDSVDRLRQAMAPLSRSPWVTSSWTPVIQGRQVIREALRGMLEDVERLAKEMDSIRDPATRLGVLRSMVRSSQRYSEFGEPDRALALVRDAITKAESLIAASPTPRQIEEILVSAIEWAILIETDHARALEQYRRSEILVTKLRTGSPDHDARLDQTRLLNALNVCQHRGALGRQAESIDQMRLACSLGEPLVQGPHKDNGLSLAALARAYIFLAGYDQSQGRIIEAEAGFSRAAELLRRHHALQPDLLEAVADEYEMLKTLQNFFSSVQKYEQATKSAEELLGMLETALARPGWSDSDRLGLLNRQLEGRYMLGIQHAENQKHYADANDQKRFDEAVAAFEKTMQETTELGDALRLIVRNSSEVDYYTGISCINRFFIRHYRKQLDPEAERLLRKGCELLEQSVKLRPDQARSNELQQAREALAQSFPEKKPAAPPPGPARPGK